MFDKKSDYAKNKRNADSIIYTDANGEEIRLTRDDFESEEEFRKWKAWSDSQYHETEKNGRSYMDHKLPLFDEEGTNGDTMESDEANPESMLISAVNEQEQTEYFRADLKQVREKLTDIQFRRLWLYKVKGMTQQKIADLEGVRQVSISKTIIAARKKLARLRDEEKRSD